MSSLKPTAIISAIGAGLGGVAAGCIVGPSAIVHGLKIGLGLGVQVGVINRAETAVDAVGERVNRIADTVEGKLVSTIENVAQTWSTLMLAGYAMQIALNGTQQALTNYNSHNCNAWNESLNCASLSMTTLSMNGAAIAIGLSLTLKVINMLHGKQR